MNVSPPHCILSSTPQKNYVPDSSCSTKKRIAHIWNEHRTALLAVGASVLSLTAIGFGLYLNQEKSAPPIILPEQTSDTTPTPSPYPSVDVPTAQQANTNQTIEAVPTPSARPWIEPPATEQDNTNHTFVAEPAPSPTVYRELPCPAFDVVSRASTGVFVLLWAGFGGYAITESSRRPTEGFADLPSQLIADAKLWTPFALSAIAGIVSLFVGPYLPTCQELVSGEEK